MKWISDSGGAARSFKVNVAANYAAVAISGGVSLALMPMYSGLLGDRAWGMVSLCMLVQSIVMIFDMGLAQTMPRDVAQASASQARLDSVLGAYVRTYLLLACVISMVGLLATPWLVSLWFKDADSNVTMVWAAQLAVLCGATQLLNGACLGYWSGTQQQALAVRRTAMFLVARSILILTVLNWVDRSVTAFLSCMLVAYSVELLSNLNLLRRARTHVGWHHAVFKDGVKLMRRNSGVAVSVLLGALVSQMDRIVLSRSITASDFGVYTIVLMLGLAFMQLQYPLMTALYPRVALDHQRTMLAGNFLKMLVVCVMPCCVVAVVAGWVLPVYLGRQSWGADAILTFRWILAGVALNALYQVLYQYMVVEGAGRWLMVTNFMNLLWVFLITSALASEWGMLAGALAWFGCGVVQFVSGVLWWVVERRGD